MDEIETTKKYYNENALQWSSIKTDSFYHQKQFELFIQNLPKDGRVLDIGCAGAIHVPLFLGIGRNLEYVGVDISDSFITIAKNRYPQLDFREGDISAAETLPKERFDGFWAASVLMHIPHEQWPNMFKNIQDISTPKAIGYLCLPTERTSDILDSRHFTILNPKEQQRELENNDWKILEKGIFDGYAKKSIWQWYIVQLP